MEELSIGFGKELADNYEQEFPGPDMNAGATIDTERFPSSPDH